VQPTPLAANEISAILEVRIGPTVFPVYDAARLTRKPLDGTH
jgi:hypothetical protein